MRDATALPADLLDGPLAVARDVDDAGAAARIAHIAQLADRGDHAAAAREAATLLEARLYDVRLVGFYLFGLFLQRGIAELPALLDRIGRLVADHLDVLRPGRRKLQVINSATASLFEQVSTQVQFHAKQRDATWDAWRVDCDVAMADAIAAGCLRVTLVLEAVIDAPLAAAPLARLRRWASDDLRRAVARRDAVVEHVAPLASGAIRGLLDPAGARPPDARGDARAEEAGSDALEPSDPLATVADHAPGAGLEAPADPAADPVLPPAVEPPPDPAAGVVAVGSPALAILQAKLRGFQRLIARGELARAAVVASDVRAVLADFDPVTFFPTMFAAYFRALHQVIDELAPYLDGTEAPAWHALDSYYRADMHGFFED